MRGERDQNALKERGLEGAETIEHLEQFGGGRFPAPCRDSRRASRRRADGSGVRPVPARSFPRPGCPWPRRFRWRGASRIDSIMDLCSSASGSRPTSGGSWTTASSTRVGWRMSGSSAVTAPNWTRARGRVRASRALRRRAPDRNQSSEELFGVVRVRLGSWSPSSPEHVSDTSLPCMETTVYRVASRSASGPNTPASPAPPGISSNGGPSPRTS